MRKRLRRAGPWLTGAYAAALILCLVVTLVVCVHHPDARSSSIFGPILRTDAGEPLELPALTWANGAIWSYFAGQCILVVIGLSWDFRRWYLNRTAEGDG